MMSLPTTEGEGMRVIVLIPAHNEAESIGATLSSVYEQTRRPDHVVVVCDNCTDGTYEIAEAMGADAVQTHKNEHKKAGALNQALDWISSVHKPEDYVLVMDADTKLNPEFIETALERFSDRVAAVGGSFFCAEESNMLQVMQGNEYARYVREIARKKGKANVLTGAGSVFRLVALQEVKQARATGLLPGQGFYDQSALTEDNELTLALKTLGYSCVAPKTCEIYTEAPETWKQLYHQRIRWRRGAMQNLKDYGLSRVTAPYLLKTLWSGFAVLVSFLYVLLVTIMLTAGVSVFSLHPLWISVFALYVTERVWTVRKRKKGLAVAAGLIPEIAYDLFQQFVYVVAAVAFFTKRQEAWIH
jgi:poly-beta-1,6-N-acetyl-D-glucosamine synthase